MVAAPSVLDVLRNLGGFKRTTASYLDHSLIDQSVYGDYPIIGEMMYDYVVLGGHLDSEDSEDSYWTSGDYVMAQQSGFMVYSNPGYSMLGELVRVRTGLSYEDYVRTQLLEPLNLHQEIYPDPGHRNAHRVPTKAGLRSYLINTQHPYSSSPPLLASEPVPKPALVGVGLQDGSPEWSANAGPIDSSAPATAATERYAGGAYLGGAPLAAGGWVADGESLGVLTRVIAQGSFHNTEYDFTVVYLTNVIGNGLVDLLNPLLTPVNGVWGTSLLGSQFLCVDDLSTFQNECFGDLVAY